MKLKSLEHKYLQGIIDALIGNYDAHCKSIPDHTVSYSMEFGIIGGENKDSAKITINWIYERGEITNPFDTENEPEYAEDKVTEESFIISAGDTILKVQTEIEYILDKVTG